MTPGAFRPGDYVIVRTGKFAGQGGFVVRVGRTVTVRLRRAGQWYHVAFSPESLTLKRPA